MLSLRNAIHWLLACRTCNRAKSRNVHRRQYLCIQHASHLLEYNQDWEVFVCSEGADKKLDKAKITQGALDLLFIIPFNIMVNVLDEHAAGIACKTSVIKGFVL